jgi:hypothetical protein
MFFTVDCEVKLSPPVFFTVDCEVKLSPPIFFTVNCEVKLSPPIFFTVNCEVKLRRVPTLRKGVQTLLCHHGVKPVGGDDL